MVGYGTIFVNQCIGPKNVLNLIPVLCLCMARMGTVDELYKLELQNPILI